ncbi:alpha-N-acetylglucosaminidase C-terminal domain-containing protein (plasmid) [Embleya sp. NBC_00888]|uniref:alpha-N-acetylglucosaminidase n=1 Tax=Embleya sp. NBC_00888 TaxID=2975960 RepID=UPI002F90C2A2|nr:alpha-N-acetylglucosaminidase C-terminal domain-containing protein [Embleya sp. NBC_00888]
MSLNRRTLLTAATATAGALLASSALPAVAASAAGADVRAARRLLPDYWRQFTFEPLPAGGGLDAFRVSGSRGRILVQGSTPAVRLRGMYWYLKHVAHANISWVGEQLRLPAELPAVPTPVTVAANVPHRFALNDCNDGYTGAYHDWDYWEREIDVLALHGYNEVLVYTGADAVYHRVFQQFGYGEAELRAWIPGPAHQPWWLLQNMSTFAGPVSRHLLDKRAELGRKIVGRLRELGMTPVLPGYFGTVPDGFAERNPGAHTVPQGNWVGFRRPDWLDPRGEHFRRVAAAYYQIQRELFGDSTMYKMDMLHEGGRPGDVPVPDAVRAVQTALLTARPGAIWAILGWGDNPSKTFMGAVDRTKTLVLDGVSDHFATVNHREDDWLGAPYAFGSIWNFGGHTAMGANTPDWAALYHSWLAREGSTLSGIALLPESADNNPAALELFSELAWTPAAPDLKDWFAEYALSRYGSRDENAARAWDILRRTAYGTTRADSYSEPADSLFGARPSLTATTACTWSPHRTRYDDVVFAGALPALLAVSSALRSTSAYADDLLDVARQVLTNQSRVLLPQIKAAYDAGDRTRLLALAQVWLARIDLLDELVSTRPSHLLGRWEGDARRWGADQAESDRLAYDALSLLTVWGHRSGADDGGLRDYANREWGGLVGGLYRQRWAAYFDELAAALAEDRAPKPIDWYAKEEAWTRNPGRLATTPRGDTHRLAQRVRDTLASDPYQLVAHLVTDSEGLGPTTPLTATLTLANRGGLAPATGLQCTLSVPAGVTAEPLTPTTVPALAPGENFTARWKITLTGEPVELLVPIRALAEYRVCRTAGSVTGTAKALVEGGLSPEYTTVDRNRAVFGQRGDRFAVSGGGTDLWGATAEFGAVTLAGGLSANATVTTRVTAQDRTGPWARAGIFVRNDLAAPASGGFVGLALTPDNGVVLTWDADGNGTIDTVRRTLGPAAPVHLRLTRRGTAFTGAFSADGSTWTDVATVTVGSAAAVQDVGIGMSAANGGSGARGSALFEGFKVTAP